MIYIYNTFLWGFYLRFHSLENRLDLNWSILLQFVLCLAMCYATLKKTGEFERKFFSLCIVLYVSITDFSIQQFLFIFSKWWYTIHIFMHHWCITRCSLCFCWKYPTRLHCALSYCQCNNEFLDWNKSACHTRKH